MCRAAFSICNGMCFDAFYSLRLVIAGTSVKCKNKRTEHSVSPTCPLLVLVVDTTLRIIAFLPPPMRVMEVGGFCLYERLSWLSFNRMALKAVVLQEHFSVLNGNREKVMHPSEVFCPS